jgi:hypothetical protein
MMASAEIAFEYGMKCQSNKNYEEALIHYAMAVEVNS